MDVLPDMLQLIWIFACTDAHSHLHFEVCECEKRRARKEDEKRRARNGEKGNKETDR